MAFSILVGSLKENILQAVTELGLGKPTQAKGYKITEAGAEIQRNDVLFRRRDSAHDLSGHLPK